MCNRLTSILAVPAGCSHRMTRTVHLLAHAGSHRAVEGRKNLPFVEVRIRLAHLHTGELAVGNLAAVGGRTVEIDRRADSQAEEWSSWEDTDYRDLT